MHRNESGSILVNLIEHRLLEAFAIEFWVYVLATLLIVRNQEVKHTSRL